MGMLSLSPDIPLGPVLVAGAHADRIKTKLASKSIKTLCIFPLVSQIIAIEYKYIA